MQRFCKEVVTWRSLEHPNVLSLIGVTMSETQFAMVSDWMEKGSINEFVRANPDINRLELVSVLPKISRHFKFIDWTGDPAGRCR